ncbi:MAG: MFS transporter [Chloroflexota bacterium]|nr:MFS transporter [Chloroflexota bacterium]
MTDVESGANGAPKRSPRVFYGWWIVAANAVMSFYQAGAYFYGFGAFINPLRQSFGWSYAQISLAFSLRSAETGPIAPLAGYLVDRLGARPVALMGAALTGLGFFLLSYANSLAMFYLLYLLLALGASLLAPIMPVTNIANWFIRKRGRAIGLYTAGAGMSGLLVPVVTWLLSVYDWRSVLVMIGVGMWVLGVPLSLVLRHRPEKYGMHPDGDERPPPAITHVKRQEVEGFSTREALKDRSFWLLTVALMLSFAPLNAVSIFLIPYVSDPIAEHGLALVGAMAGAAVTIMTLTSLAGRFAFGWLADYRQPRHIMMWLLVLQAAGLVALANVHSTWHLIPFFVLFAPAYGGIIAVRPVILAQYYGRHALGMIQGLTMALMTVGGVLTPLVVGFLKDATGGYQWAFLVFAMVTLAGVPLLWLARGPAAPPHEGGSETGHP